VCVRVCWTNIEEIFAFLLCVCVCVSIYYYYYYYIIIDRSCPSVKEGDREREREKETSGDNHLFKIPHQCLAPVAAPRVCFCSSYHRQNRIRFNCCLRCCQPICSIGSHLFNIIIIIIIIVVVTTIICIRHRRSTKQHKPNRIHRASKHSRVSHLSLSLLYYFLINKTYLLHMRTIYSTLTLSLCVCVCFCAL
jgi:uncharacterized protein YxeA